VPNLWAKNIDQRQQSVVWGRGDDKRDVGRSAGKKENE
jgi:hypothetical protein